MSAAEQKRETFRRRARWVLDDEEGWLTLRAKWKTGKLSPQEFRELKEAGYHFDIEEKPAPPPVTIQILQQFADGTTDAQAVVVTGAGPK